MGQQNSRICQQCGTHIIGGGERQKFCCDCMRIRKNAQQLRYYYEQKSAKRLAKWKNMPWDELTETLCEIRDRQIGGRTTEKPIITFYIQNKFSGKIADDGEQYLTFSTSSAAIRWLEHFGYNPKCFRIGRIVEWTN